MKIDRRAFMKSLSPGGRRGAPPRRLGDLALRRASAHTASSGAGGSPALTGDHHEDSPSSIRPTTIPTDRRRFPQSNMVGGGGLLGAQARGGTVFDSRSSIRLIGEAARQIRDGTHKVGIVPHFTSPIGSPGHLHTMMAFPGQVLMEYNYGERPVNYLPEFLECRNGKVWSNDRPGLGGTLDEKRLTFVEEFITAAPGPTYRRPNGSLTHW
jgi:hypothetical protein